MSSDTDTKTTEHTNAQNRILGALKEGCKIQCVGKCKDCNMSMNLTYTFDVHSEEIELEYRANDKQILDIGIYNRSTHSLKGIEIYSTHGTSGFNRCGVDSWMELSAREILETENIDEKVFQNYRNFCDECGTRPGKFILEQHGAGSGKTHGALVGIDAMVSKGKRLFIFTSKTNSAIGAISEKIKLEIASGKYGFSELYESVEMLTDENDTKTRWSCFSLVQKETGEKFIILCGTLDSYIAGLSINKDNYVPGEDIFRFTARAAAKSSPRLVSEVVRKVIGKVCPDFSHCVAVPSEIHIFIDEAQDLEWYYPAAFAGICAMGCSVSIIGDVLQTVFTMHEPSVHKMGVASFMKLVSPVSVVMTPPSNTVRRCTHKDWPSILGELVPFEKYGTVHPTLASESAPPTEQNVSKVLTVSSANKTSNIRDIFEESYCAGFKEPKDYLVILTYVSRNRDRNDLENEITRFWDSKRGKLSSPDKCIETISDDSAEDDEDVDLKMPVLTHCADAYGPINKKESEDKTRIMSIHASKGDGRPVVIWWDADSNAVQSIYSPHGDLGYDSLCHVAITRHRHRLYLAIKKVSPLICKIFDIAQKYQNVIEIRTSAQEAIKNIETTSKIKLSSENVLGEALLKAGFIPEILDNADCVDDGTCTRIEDDASRIPNIDMFYHLIRAKTLNFIGDIFAWACGEFNDDGKVEIVKKKHSIHWAIRVLMNKTNVEHEADPEKLNRFWKGTMSTVTANYFPVRYTRLANFLIKNDTLRRTSEWCKRMNAIAMAAKNLPIKIPSIPDIDLIMIVMYVYEAVNMYGARMTEQDLFRSLSTVKDVGEGCDGKKSIVAFMVRLTRTSNIMSKIFESRPCDKLIGTARASQVINYELSKVSERTPKEDRIELSNGFMVSLHKVPDNDPEMTIYRLIPVIDGINFYDVLAECAVAVRFATVAAQNDPSQRLSVDGLPAKPTRVVIVSTNAACEYVPNFEALKTIADGNCTRTLLEMTVQNKLVNECMMIKTLTSAFSKDSVKYIQGQFGYKCTASKRGGCRFTSDTIEKILEHSKTHSSRDYGALPFDIALHAVTYALYSCRAKTLAAIIGECDDAVENFVNSGTTLDLVIAKYIEEWKFSRQA